MASTSAFLSRPQPSGQTSELASSTYSERIILPLPKRRIKSRLSNEQAEAIVYPPVPPSSSPLFGSPYSQPEQVHPLYSQHDADHQPRTEHDHVCGCGRDHSDVDSDPEEEERRGVAHRYSWSGSMQRYPRLGKSENSSRPKPPPPNSSNSSADGYESFENTNNKKKRKIPVSGAGSYLSHGADLATNTVIAQSDAVSEDDRSNGHYYATGLDGVSSQGSVIGGSTSGRGRYMRPPSRPFFQRQPLGSSPNSVNAYQNGIPQRRATEALTPATMKETQITPGQMRNSGDGASVVAGKGKENFTFNAPSESSKKMGLVPQGGLLPAPPLPLSGPGSQSTANMNGTRGIATSGTQTGPGMVTGPNGQAVPHHAAPQNNQQPPPAQPPVDTKETLRRNHNRELRLQARQRRLQAEYGAFHNPPRREDVWICEFCEYESVFGSPPRAFIRRFEETQMKKQKQLEEQRRLLEKAKKGNRKNRKAGKGGSKNTAASGQHQQAQSQSYDLQYDNLADQDIDGQSDDLFDPGYSDVPPLPNHMPGTNGSIADLYDPGDVLPAIGSQIGSGNSRAVTAGEA